MKQSKDYQNALSATRKELHEMEIGKGMWPAIQYANQMLRDLVQRDGFREDATMQAQADACEEFLTDHDAMEL